MFLERACQRFTWLVVCIGALNLTHGIGRAQTPRALLERDMLHTVQARKLLLDDPVLSPLNLGVRVTNRKALLWGEVPSREVAAHAERRLRTMFELSEVRSRLTIDPEAQVAPRVPLVPQFLPEPAPPVLPEPPRAPVRPPDAGVRVAGRFS